MELLYPLFNTPEDLTDQAGRGQNGFRFGRLLLLTVMPEQRVRHCILGSWSEQESEIKAVKK